MKTDKKSEKGGFKYLLSRKADRVTKRIKLTEEDFARVSTSNPLKFTTFPQTKAIRVPATRICPGTLVPKENPTYCEYIWKFNETKTEERAPEECPTCGSTLTKRAEKAEYITGKNWVISATKPWVLASTTSPILSLVGSSIPYAPQPPVLVDRNPGFV